MNYRELARIQKIVKQVKALKELRRLMKTLKGLDREEAVEGWLKEHRTAMKELDEQELASLREQADYDEDAWQEILTHLR